MKLCYSTSFSLPKQAQNSGSILQDRSRFLALFLNKKSSILKPKNTVIQRNGTEKTGPKVIKLFSCSTQLSMKF